MTVLRGDCVEVMAGMDADSVDAIVTDPPYDLLTSSRNGSPRINPGTGPASRHASRAGGFMGKAWDASGVAFRPETWSAALRVAKPGAYLLAFGGTRTVHRMTCALEDAGWVVRDMLVWAYAQGFPKSRASLKPAWEPIVLCRKPGASRDLRVDEARLPALPGDYDHPGNDNRTDGGQRTYGSDDAAGQQTKPSPLGRWPSNVLLTSPIFDGGWEGVVGGGEAGGGFGTRGKAGSPKVEGWGYEQTGQVVGYGDSGTYSRFFLIGDTRSTALSGTMDACPTCSASTAERPSGTRDDATATAATSAPETPGEPSAPGASGAESRSLWGGTSTAPSPAPTPPDGTPVSTASEAPSDPSASGTRTTGPSSSPAPQPATAYPSGQPASPAEPPPTSTGTTTTTTSRWTCGHSAEPATTGSTPQPPRPSSAERHRAESPDYPRFYLQPKAPTRERVLSDGRRSPHPTQKPEALIRHLVNLVTPPDGLVLDPFLGSGTLGVVADGLGVRWLGIEREAEYADWAEDRIADKRPEWAVA